VFVRTASGALDVYTGPIAAEPLDSTHSGACGSPYHSAIWSMQLRSGKQELDLPLFVGAPASAVGANGVELDLCPDVTGPSIVAIVLSLSGLDAPKSPGDYVWRADVTPLSPDGTLTLASAYELQAVVAVPHVLTLRAAYDPAKRRARLSGTLRLHGRPQAGARIVITRLDRTITPHGPVFRDAPVAVARTDRSGKYAVSVQVRRTQGFVAATLPTSSACPVASAPPAGCVSLTRAGAESEPLTVSVP